MSEALRDRLLAIMFVLLTACGKNKPDIHFKESLNLEHAYFSGAPR